MSAPVTAEVAPAPKPLRRDAAQNRTRLLAAARQVFAEHGLDASVDEVARVAGVGMGTLYRRFPTKDALIAELVRDLLEDVLDLARAALTVPGGLGLKQFLFASAGAEASRRGCLARLWSDPQTLALKNECRAAIGELLKEAQLHGQVRADAEMTDIDLVFWSLRGVIEATNAISDTGWRRHVAIMMAGLAPSSRPLTEAPMAAEHAEMIRRPAKAE